MKKVLFIPSTEKGNGTGHLKRCIKWAASSLYEGKIHIPEERLSELLGDVYPASLLGDAVREGRIITALKQCNSIFDAAVLDMRKTAPDFLETVKSYAHFVFAVDEGSEKARAQADYLADTLPGLFCNPLSRKGKTALAANVSSPHLLGIPDIRSKTATANRGRTFHKILVSFGGEDTASLTRSLLEFAAQDSLFAETDVTVVLGPLYRGRDEIKRDFSSFRFCDSPESLYPLIEDADLVITSFGITAYEALYSGKPVILVNPSDYHKKLSDIAGFPSAGVLKPDFKVIKKMINNPSGYDYSLMDSLPPGNAAAGGEMEKLVEMAAGKTRFDCPVCGNAGELLMRLPEKNYRKCGACGIVYLQNFGPGTREYTREYFFSEYRAQYGKTYLEDFDNIEAACVKRAEIIRGLKKSGSVLDIGCAYGPFLKVMNSLGYKCSGTDISSDAVDYVRGNLGISAFVSDFSSGDFRLPADVDKQFEIITMWYVIEHFMNTGEILKRVSKLLPRGGIFAFSTPNLNGISGRSRMRAFLSSSPRDHYTVWSISSACRILEKHGFRVLLSRWTGHHPERFPAWIRGLLGESLTGFASRLFGLGDTFEIYSVKVD